MFPGISNKRIVLSVVLCLSSLCLPGEAQEKTALEAQVETVRALVAKKPNLNLDQFHPDFLAAVPKARLYAIGQTFFNQAGSVVRVTRNLSKGDLYGEYTFRTEKGFCFPVKLGIAATPPHQINTLWFGNLQAILSSLEEGIAGFRELGGQVSLAVWKLDEEKPEILAALNPDLPLGIGSTFKLYILGALARGIDENNYSWDQVIPLRNAWKSWPSGALHIWPDGTPLTLFSLAAAMISVSDNTATDHLLFFLGREKIEAMLAEMGHGKPALNIPFLSTRELFLIKSVNHQPERIEAYLARDLEGRRDYLREVIAAIPREEFVGINELAPTAIRQMEWFASASDCCRAMAWMKAQGEAGMNSAGLLSVLAINRGLQFSDAAWDYVGYKGGSEPGVLNLTWLLKKKDGPWLALSAGWNNPDQVLAEDQFMNQVQQVIDRLAEMEF